MVIVKGGGREPPILTSQANFTFMMECTPESGLYHSVYSVDTHLLAEHLAASAVVVYTVYCTAVLCTGRDTHLHR